MAEADSRARVVIVDDSRTMGEFVSDALRERVRVEICTGAAAALEVLEREPADLVISDLQMEGMSGLELLDRVRERWPDVPFVLLAANASVGSAVEALRRGAADYIEKPAQSEQLVATVERQLVHRRLLQENKRLRATAHTLQSCRALMHCLEAGEVFAVALDLLLPAVGRERGLAVFRHASMPGSEGMAFRGFGEGAATELQRSLIDGKLGSDLAVVEEPTVVEGGPIGEALEEVGVGAGVALAVPVRESDAEEGILWVPEQGRPFGPPELEQAAIVAAQAELALANAERYHRAKERAFIDDVTEVYNARYLLQATEHEIRRAERYGKELSVLFLDLDRFKLVNDRYGHLAGSRVLRRLSEVLLECVRQVDTLARYGGDEFTILLVDTGHSGAVAVAERIRRTVAETLFEGSGDAPVGLTISIGVATFPDHSGDRDTLLDFADKAMYRAKSLGRNCVCSATEL